MNKHGTRQQIISRVGTVLSSELYPAREDAMEELLNHCLFHLQRDELMEQEYRSLQKKHDLYKALSINRR